MTRPSLWFLRSALIHLALGFTFGGLLLWNKGVPIHPLLWRLLPAHMEFLLLGWTVQLAMGVAYWILPRFYTQRGDVRPVWLAFVLLNGGVWLAGMGATLAAPAWVILAGRLCEAGAAAAFAFNAWPRVKPMALAASHRE